MCRLYRNSASLNLLKLKGPIQTSGPVNGQLMQSGTKRQKIQKQQHSVPSQKPWMYSSNAVITWGAAQLFVCFRSCRRRIPIWRCWDKWIQTARQTERVQGCWDKWIQTARQTERVQGYWNKWIQTARQTERVQGCWNKWIQTARQTERVQGCWNKWIQTARQTERVQGCADIPNCQSCLSVI